MSPSKASTDWYRNTAWNDAVEASFFEKLARARQKAQYVRIQASTLAATRPDVALRLLDQYFSFDDRIDRAPAYVDKATAHLALGQKDLAIAAYEAALAVEASFPQVRTSAGSDVAMLVAVNRMTDRYDQALQVSVWPPGQLELPALRFAYHAPRALIFADRGLKEDAQQEAKAALAAADRQHSGLSRHPTFGLVANDDSALKERLMQIAGLRAGSVMSRIRQTLFG